MKFAAIDIGSNAARLLFCNVFEREKEIVFKKEELFRVPIRLGEDVFSKGYISDEKKERLIKIVHAFSLLIDVGQVISYRACATAAMREAANGQQILEEIKKITGINVEVIDGSTEAQLIYANHIAEELEPNIGYLYIDVGGGSTECTLFYNGKTIFSRSYNIGTIRMLQNKVSKEYFSEFKSQIRELTADYKALVGIGSGGNINKIIKMAKKQNKPLTLAKLHEINDNIKSYSLNDRIEVLGLKPDRADVIEPALKIFITIMEHTGINYLVVPEIGLADGIVHALYETHKSNQQGNLLPA
ncbi:MAG: exopolyphosphatase [Bacteroidetes bacterium]|nr:exopolyphosphatase [Bacteroidota bacterium]